MKDQMTEIKFCSQRIKILRFKVNKQKYLQQKKKRRHLSPGYLYL